MLTSEEQALLVHLNRYFDGLVERGARLEPSLEILVRTLAMVLAVELEAAGGEAALTRTVEPYARLLKTWTREAFQFATRRPSVRVPLKRPRMAVAPRSASPPRTLTRQACAQTSPASSAGMPT